MNRYTWYTVGHDGTILQRWNPDNTENIPHPDNTAEIHLLPSAEGHARGLRTFSLFLKPGQRLIFKKRRHLDGSSGELVEDHGSVVYLIGYEVDLGHAHFASYAALLPDGRVEWSSSYNHITRHERNLDEHPLKLYETWSAV